MWRTPGTSNQAFVHIKSIGRYDTEGQLVIGRLTSNVPLEICIFQRPGQYTEGEAESLRPSPRFGGATPLLPLSPRYISRKETAALGSGLKLQRHRPLSTTGARDHKKLKNVSCEYNRWNG